MRRRVPARDRRRRRRRGQAAQAEPRRRVLTAETAQIASFPLVVLVVLDGWGCAPPGPGNAVELAETPVFDRLWQSHPHTTIEASGEAAGLPPGQMGNSEVGHLTIGAGRRLYQDLMRVNKAIEDGSFFENDALRGAFERGRRVHLLGLVSHGGVHSHIDHLRALLRFAPEKTWIHAFTDGRDVSPTSAVHDLAELPVDRIATVVGRYYAMDRDQRWERTRLAFDALTRDVEVIGGNSGASVLKGLEDSYKAGITDEFIEPIVVPGTPSIEPGDSVIFFNFRPDRARQLSRLLVDAGFDLTTMTRYAEEIDTPVVFAEQQVTNTVAEVLSSNDMPQLHAAETEKYAHVTYFFNGGVEEAWAGEQRILVPSPRDVPSYDHKPEMSAVGLTDRFCDEISKGYRFAVINFANPDMVGHTGVIPAVVRAVETADRCLGRVVDRVSELGGVCLITADHGNAEQELQPDGSPHTAHTTNPVPLIITTSLGGGLREGGELADLVPTALRLLGLNPPAEMTGKDLMNPEPAS